MPPQFRDILQSPDEYAEYVIHHNYGPEFYYATGNAMNICDSEQQESKSRNSEEREISNTSDSMDYHFYSTKP